MAPAMESYFGHHILCVYMPLITIVRSAAQNGQTFEQVSNDSEIPEVQMQQLQISVEKSVTFDTE